MYKRLQMLILNYTANEYEFQIRIIVERFIQIYITLVG